MSFTLIEEVTPFELGQNFAREGKDYCPYQDNPQAEKEFHLGVESYKRRTVWPQGVRPKGCPTTRINEDANSN